MAPVALLLAAERGLSLEAALDAYAAGFETTAALARASHPALYERGWHPTAVCGVAGAAVAAARLLDLEPDRERAAVGISLLRAGGLQAAFGTDGKALQVGLAAATGLEAARLSAAGAGVSADAIATGFEAAYGGTWEVPRGRPAIGENWIKAYPCCLMTHSAIDAAQALRAGKDVPAGEIVVTVHPTARRAAPCDDPADGLEAKFSIGYTTAHTLLHGPPSVESFAAPDAAARSFAAAQVRVRTDPAPARDRGAARGRRAGRERGPPRARVAAEPDGRRVAGAEGGDARARSGARAGRPRCTGRRRRAGRGSARDDATRPARARCPAARPGTRAPPRRTARPRCAPRPG